MSICRSRRQRWCTIWPVAVGAAMLSACTSQPPHIAMRLPAPAAWSVPATTAVEDVSRSEQWWTRMNDDAINNIVATALLDNPTVHQAVARIHEADANLAMSSAQRLPALQANLGGSRARSADGNQASTSSVAVAGLALSWEVDLFGRVRSTVDSARFQLDARHADAEAARLSLAARIADTVLSLRGCRFAQAVLGEDVQSRTVTLELTRRKLAAGALALVEEARARSSLADARTLLTSREQQCSGHINALVALSGIDAATLHGLLDAPLASPPPQAAVVLPRYAQWVMPAAPTYQLALPAAVLARHPGVRAAEAAVASAWAEIGIARAERLPRLDLGAALSGQWLRAAGNSIDTTRYDRLWSLAPSLTLPVFDNGRGAAAVSVSQARYRQALAVLHGTVRDAVRDIENALDAQRSAQARLQTARAAADAAQTVFDATDAMWRAGATSLFVLEDARRLLAGAQNDAITAAQDGAQAWIALTLACGHSPLTTESKHNET